MRLEVKMVVVLVAVSLGAAALLGVVFGFTAPVIAGQREAAREEALSMLLPEAVDFKPDTIVENGDTNVIYLAYDKGGKKIGLIFTVAPKGYAGPVETMVGLRSDSTISAIRIASAAEGLKETPGLGARVLEDWFRDQFNGLKQPDLYLKKEGGKIEAITAATISSNAVTTGVRDGFERYLPYLGDDKAPSSLQPFNNDSTSSSSETTSPEPELVKKVMTAQGYGGEFKVVVYFDSGKIAKVEIPKKGFNETTGLGTQCCEPGFVSKFVGLSSAEEVAKVEAVSGATVTSSAVKDAIARSFAQ